MSHTPRSSRPARSARWQNLLRLASVSAVLAATGCAQTPQQQAYHSALEHARTDPSFCYSHQYDTLLAEAMQRDHSLQSSKTPDRDDKPDSSFQPTMAISVTGATAMPDLSLPPYFHRVCRLSTKLPDGKTENGFLTFTYLIRENKVQSALTEWYSDAEVTQEYDATMKQIEAGLDMNNPDLKSCIQRYPAFDAPSKDPIVQQGALDLRAHLVRRCLANKAALKDLYSDLYFIHR
ncbi:hypothetical protein [Acetobacter persici]|nr:hypothetical protein [Acetobacter persici]MBS0962254.1 hypothetical protein [Acetobacter persici]MBS1000468.1 hypothetical protein [Acetobacter persici]MCG0997499.1 hypothetical protein [Acetobacter persici]MCP9318685.1 hypothetical protein [Acetobacter persici]GFE92210.1 hypothetical protein DmAi_02690 [Acetobacter persici]